MPRRHKFSQRAGRIEFDTLPARTGQRDPAVSLIRTGDLNHITVSDLGWRFAIYGREIIPVVLHAVIIDDGIGKDLLQLALLVIEAVTKFGRTLPRGCIGVRSDCLLPGHKGRILEIPAERGETAEPQVYIRGAALVGHDAADHVLIFAEFRQITFVPIHRR